MTTNNIGAAFRGSAGLTRDYYEALVTASMEPYRLAVRRAESRKDDLVVKKAVYNDLGTKMGALYNAVEGLRQLDDEESVFDSKKVSSTAAVSGDPVSVTGSATADAADATYTVNVTNLAEAHRIRSDKQTDSTTALSHSGTFSLNGVSVDVTTDQSLQDIMDTINSKMQAAVDDETISADQKVTATIVDNQLVLKASATGTANAMSLTDTTNTVLESLGILNSGAIKNTLQAAEDAMFNIDGIDITRSSNSEIDDVITGVTLTLKEEGESTLGVGPDTASVEGAINAFVSKLNDLNKWLKVKTTTRDNGDGTYSRGSLSNSYGIRGLRRNLIQTAFATWNGGGGSATYTRLDQIGLKLGDELVATVESGDLSDALATDYEGVVALFDGIMDNISAILEPYTEGSDTLVDKMKKSAEDAISAQGNKVDRLQSSFERREELIRDQIAMQFASISGYNDQGRFLMTAMYGGFNAVG